MIHPTRNEVSLHTLRWCGPCFNHLYVAWFVKHPAIESNEKWTEICET